MNYLDTNYILKYYQEILDKKVVVSNKVKKQFDKIVDDLNQPGKYHFDI